MKKWLYFLLSLFTALFVAVPKLLAFTSAQDPAQWVAIALNNSAITALQAQLVWTFTWANILFLIIQAALFLLLAQILWLLTFDPDTPDSPAQDLDTNISGIDEGVPLPVVFGVARLGSTVINHDESTFRVEKIYKTIKYKFVFVSKSDTYVSNHDYYYSWVEAICCGEVDGIRKIWGEPEDRPSPELSQGGWTYPNGTIGADGKYIRLYPGASTQNRASDTYSGDGMNYRGVCFAVYDDFYLGRDVATVPAHTFEVRRLPKCLDENGATFGMNTTIGDEANPAAVVYEALTNKYWGKGVDPAIIDKSSFVSASDYFASKSIGVSYVLEEKMSVADFLEMVQKHTDLIIQYQDGKIFCYITTRQDTYYSNIISINPEDIVDFSVERDSWAATYNEVRGVFRDSEKELKTSVVHLTEAGNVSLTGNVRSYEEDYEMFIRRNLVSERLERLMREVSTPKTRLRLELNRHEMRLLPSDLISIEWEDWFNGKVKLYAKVVSVNSNDSDSSVISVSAEEDIYTPAYLYDIAAPTSTDPEAQVVMIDENAPESNYDNGDVELPDDSDVTLPPTVELPDFLNVLSITAVEKTAEFYSSDGGNIVLFPEVTEDVNSVAIASLVIPSMLSLESEGEITVV